MSKKLFLLTFLALVPALAGSDAAFGALVVEVRVSAGPDDAEQAVNAGNQDTYNTSSDLELVDDNNDNGGRQFVGMNFRNVQVPLGAQIKRAYIEFACDASKFNSDPAYLLLWGHLALNPDGFGGPLGPTTISDLPRTEAQVPWEPEPWTTGGQISQTSNISSIINEVISQDGWAPGNAIEIIVGEDASKGEFTGFRAAESFNGVASLAPLLVIELSTKFASSPSPADGTLYEDTWASLGWEAGETSVTHDVYMSDNFDDVSSGAAAAFQGNQAFPFFTAGFPGFAFPDGLVPGATYYWRVDEVEADGATKYEGPVWSFSILDKTAYDPSPSDGAKAVDPDVTLSWTPGFGAKLHTVYFGDDFDTVNNATGALPQGTATFTPGTLEKDNIYYWRVDEFNPPETVKGDVWSFRTRPDIVITDPDLIGWWKLDNISGNKVLDWSGYGNDGTIGGDPQLVEGAMDLALDLDGSDYISVDGAADDLTSKDFTLSAWIKTTQVGEGNVFASNDSGGGHVLLFGVDNGNVYVDDGPSTDWPPAVNDNQWHMITLVQSGTRILLYTDGVEVASITTVIDVTAETRWSIGQEWDSSPSDFYAGAVDDARIYNKALTPAEVVELMRGDPLVAWNPKPGNKTAMDVEQAKQPLSWSPGDSAAEHDVYFGTDEGAVDLADTSTADIYRGRQAGASYSPPEALEWGTGPYFWRIDEINADGSVSSGSVWTFSVADYLSVEDFESYTDDDAANEAIWQHWIDGFGVPGNGSQVGNLLPPYAEKTIVNGGAQSIPLSYDNIAGATNSEAVLTLTGLRNWTLHDVGALSIWFRGNPASVGSFTEGPVGTFTMTGSGTDIWDNADEFHFAYKMLNGTGSIVARVDSVTNTDVWAKAGVMIRETLDPGSSHAFACVTPGSGLSSQARIDPDGSSTNSDQAGITAPHWVKLERDVAGNFTVSHSTNGSSWQPVTGAVPNRILMGTSVYVGLAVTSHNAGVTCEARFSNVTTTGQVTGQWTNQDIGIASNAAEPMYVSVANATGATAVVAHDDPVAATIDVWTEWVIPLQVFADKGINLSNVDKIAVGLGSQSGLPVVGGSGTVYLDDFRLYRVGP